MLSYKNRGLLLILILGFLPVPLWLSGNTISPITGIYDFAYLLGRVLGLVGMSFFALEFLLSARLKFFDRLFGGLDKVYKYHHILGGLAFVFLLLHPMLLTVQYLERSFYSALNFLLPNNNWAIMFGKGGLFFLMVLLILTYYVKLSYDKWKITHKFLGVAFGFAIVHLILIPSDTTSNFLLKYYLLILSFSAVLAYSYRTLLGQYFVKKYKFTVEEVTKLPGGVAQIILKPESGIFTYKPGQFMFISFQDEQHTEWHPFTISSSPTEGKLRLSIKSLGDFTRDLSQLPKGTKALVEGPFGGFTLDSAKSKKQIWLAGGIGVTPFMSMARYLQNDTQGFEIDFFYSLKNPTEATFIDELLNIAKLNKNIRVFPFYSDTQGFITADYVEQKSGSVAGKDVFLCGPMGFMIALKKQFLVKGITQVHMEEFAIRS